MEHEIKVGVIIPEIKLCNPIWNSNEILKCLKEADKLGIHIVAMPQLTLTGVSCGDLFNHDTLMDSSNRALEKMIKETKSLDIISIISHPLKINESNYIVATIISKGQIIGITPKTDLSYSEKKWFRCGKHFPKTVLLNQQEVHSGDCFEIEMNHSTYSVRIDFDETEIDCMEEKADIVFHISSSYELVGKQERMRRYLEKISFQEKNVHVYCAPGIFESSASYVYSGESLIAQKGKIESEGKKYQFESEMIYTYINQEKNQYELAENLNELTEIEKKKRKEMEKYPFVPQDSEVLKMRCHEILNMQAAALLRRLKQIGSKKTVLGLSGGSDSTLAFLAIMEAYQMGGIDPTNLIAITMPGFGTTSRTYENARALAKKYGTTFKEVSIKESCLLHYNDIGISKEDKSIVYENAQARERTQILMDIANKENAIVVGTGDLSELALGWCTYNGDHMSMYSINGGIPNTLIKEIIRVKAEENHDDILLDIIDTPISPELLPPNKNGNIMQETEKSVGPYILHDYFIYHFLRYHSSPEHIFQIAKETFHEIYSEEEIHYWLQLFIKRFFSQQFKRNCVPDGPKIGRICLSPRGDFCMPSDADGTLWNLNENEVNQPA